MKIKVEKKVKLLLKLTQKETDIFFSLLEWVAEYERGVGPLNEAARELAVSMCEETEGY